MLQWRFKGFLGSHVRNMEFNGDSGDFRWDFKNFQRVFRALQGRFRRFWRVSEALQGSFPIRFGSLL